MPETRMAPAAQQFGAGVFGRHQPDGGRLDLFYDIKAVQPATLLHLGRRPAFQQRQGIVMESK